MQSIDDVLDQWVTAERDGDAEALDTLLTDDFVGVGPLGFTLPKDAWLGRYRSGVLNNEAFDLDELQTRVHDGSAVVTARQRQRGVAGGHPIPEAARVTLALVDSGESWQITGIHLSFIAGTEGAPPMPR